MSKPKYAIASDHAGFDLKEYIKTHFNEVEWLDVGTDSAERVDYPDFASKAAKMVSDGKTPAAVLVCGSGVGMAITANKFKGVRSTVAESEVVAALCKQHNNVNVLCLGARLTPRELAVKIVKTWMHTSFEGGRHQDRLEKISILEKSR